MIRRAALSRCGPIALVMLATACGPTAVTAPRPLAPAPSAPPAPAAPPCDVCEEVHYRNGSLVDAISKTDGQWHKAIVMGTTSRSVLVLFPDIGKPEGVPRRNVRKRAP